MSWLVDAEVKTAADLDRARKDQLLGAIKQQRVAVEKQGVVLKGRHFAGDESNRNALAEARDFAEDAGMTVFPAFKDSDGVFHPDVPKADVVDARRQIGYRRMALIGKEGEYAAQIEAGTLTDVSGLSWEVI